MTSLKKWQLLKSNIVFERKWCQIKQDTVQLPNNQIIDDFFVNIRPDIALVLPITPNQEIVFVRQYRHGVGEILLELPAGAFEPKKEASIVAAKRELEEETGYVANEMIELGVLYDNPVKDTNKIHLFLAEKVQPSGERSLDVTEDIEVVLIPVQNVLDMIRQGKISVSGSVAAIFLGLNFLSQRTTANITING